MSRRRPGVAMIRWTVLYSRRMSSLSEEPPVLTITSRPKCLPRSRHTCDEKSARARWRRR
eukprot:3659021-Pleurochrysis_carterae.AAC.1